MINMSYPIHQKQKSPNECIRIPEIFYIHDSNILSYGFSCLCALSDFYLVTFYDMVLLNYSTHWEKKQFERLFPKWIYFSDTSYTENPPCCSHLEMWSAKTLRVCLGKLFNFITMPSFGLDPWKAKESEEQLMVLVTESGNGKNGVRVKGEWEAGTEWKVPCLIHPVKNHTFPKEAVMSILSEFFKMKVITPSK